MTEIVSYVFVERRRLLENELRFQVEFHLDGVVTSCCCFGVGNETSKSSSSKPRSGKTQTRCPPTIARYGRSTGITKNITNEIHHGTYTHQKLSIIHINHHVLRRWKAVHWQVWDSQIVGIPSCLYQIEASHSSSSVSTRCSYLWRGFHQIVRMLNTVS